MEKLTANIFNRIIEIGILLLIILTPIYYGSVDLVMTTVIELVILVMLLVWGAEIAVRGEIHLKKTALDIVILVFCAYSVISTLFFSSYSFASYMSLALLLSISALYFIVVNNICSKSQIIRLFVIILVVGFIQAFSHLLQNATGLLSASTGVMFNVGNHFAGYMVIIIPLAVAMSFVVKDIGKRILLIFASVIMASAMAFSLIAGAMLAFLFSLVLIALFYAGSENTRKQSLTLSIIVILLLIVVFWIGYKPVFKELLTVTSLDTGSPAGRLSLWKSTIAIFSNSPITGTGLGTFDYVYPKFRLPDLYGRAVYAHSDWLQLLAELGIIGFLIVLSGMVIFFFSIIKKFRSESFENNWEKGIVIGGLCSVGANAVHNLVEFNIHIPAIALLLVIIIALAYLPSMSYATDRRSVSLLNNETNVPKRKIHLSVPVRIIGFVCLFLIVGFSAIFILRPYDAESAYYEGMVLENNLEWDKAAEKFQLAINTSPGNSDYFYALGNIYTKKVNITKRFGVNKKWAEQALDAYFHSIEICPTDGDLHLVIGSLYEIIGNKKDSETFFTKAISLDPNNAFYHKTYGSFCLKQGDTKKAIKEYKKSLEVYPADFNRILLECYNINEESQSANSKKQAFINFAQQICPQNFNSHLTLARFFDKQNWYDYASSEYENAVKLNPDDINLWKNLSNSLMLQGNLDEAVKTWQMYIKANPNNPSAYSILARVYLEQKRFDDAIRQFLKAANINPADSSYLTQAGDIYMIQGKSSDAMKAWQSVVKRNPHSAGGAYYRLGVYYESQGDWLNSLEFLQKAISAEPRNIAYYKHLAQSYLSRELFYEAIQEFEQVIKLDPENVSVNIQLARIYSQIERQDKAKEYYLRVLNLEPWNPEARKAVMDGKG